MPNDVVGVTGEEQWTNLLREMVRQILGSRYAFEFDEVAFNPLAEYRVHAVHVTGAWSWFLGVGHSRTCMIVFVCNLG